MSTRQNESYSDQALLEQLIASISRLARPAEGQIAYLQSLESGESADELALELDDVAAAALSAPMLLSEAQRANLRDLDRQLEAMSGAERADRWSQKALATSPQWKQVRIAARAMLAELHAGAATSR